LLSGDDAISDRLPFVDRLSIFESSDRLPPSESGDEYREAAGECLSCHTEQQLQSLEQQRNELSVENDQLQKELAALRTQFEGLQTESPDKLAACRSHDEVNGLKIELAASKSAFFETQSQLNDLKTELAASKSAFSESQAKLERLKSEISQMKSAAFRSQDEIKCLRSQLSDATAAARFQDDLEGFKTALISDSSQAEISALKSELAAARSERDGLAAQLKDSQRDVKELNTEVYEANNNHPMVAELLDERKELKGELTQLHEQLDTLQKQLNSDDQEPMTRAPSIGSFQTPTCARRWVRRGPRCFGKNRGALGREPRAGLRGRLGSGGAARARRFSSCRSRIRSSRRRCAAKRANGPTTSTSRRDSSSSETRSRRSRAAMPNSEKGLTLRQRRSPQRIR
jgi:predicted  nucleic acid-binding Zn-ribbon protein